MIVHNKDRRYKLLDLLCASETVPTMEAMQAACDGVSHVTVRVYLTLLQGEGLVTFRNMRTIQVTDEGRAFEPPAYVVKQERTRAPRTPRKAKSIYAGWHPRGGTLEQRMKDIERNAIANGTCYVTATLAPQE